MLQTKYVEIVVNGEPKSVPAGLDLEQLLAVLQLDPARVAVEMNKSIVRRPLWKSTLVPESAELEIVQFVGGG